MPAVNVSPWPRPCQGHLSCCCCSCWCRCQGWRAVLPLVSSWESGSPWPGAGCAGCACTFHFCSCCGSATLEEGALTKGDARWRPQVKASAISIAHRNAKARDSPSSKIHGGPFPFPGVKKNLLGSFCAITFSRIAGRRLHSRCRFPAISAAGLARCNFISIGNVGWRKDGGIDAVGTQRGSRGVR